MKVTKVLFSMLFYLLSVSAIGVCAEESKDIKGLPEIRFGTLPVIQALPIFVADEKGYFREEGLNVNLIRFNSAMEKDVAFTSGQLTGYFGDIMTPLVLKANNTPIKIVSTIFDTPKNQRMFAVLASPKHGNKSISELAEEGLAISSNTIMEYLAVRLLATKKVAPSRIKFIEIKNIPIRLQMLMSGQIPSAVLPEPLATLAEQKGCKVILDDAGAGLSSTILAFHENFLNKNPDLVRRFHRAIEKASTFINKNHDEVRSVMNRECRIPENLQKVFPIPEFKRLVLPENTQVMDVYNWLKEKKIIKGELKYSQMVADGFLP
ncbi:MAG: MetQ/NlpA family ABC transporter substrate-binding protein [Syntrophorhabdaceae bacterium]|nr:MetQ/NlpA family ABC transporter substrate-binding protein [Syntrophorhabdaceae bacterium]